MSNTTKTNPESVNQQSVNEILCLRHNQTVRGAGFSKYTQRIIVCTARGYAADHGDDVEETYNRAIANGHETAATYQEAGVLEADYPGKAEKHAAKLAEIANAVELHEGQTVMIEDELFTVRLLGDRYSDPIKFVRKAA